MEKWEKVYKGHICCVGDGKCEECPYDGEYCQEALRRDTLEVLEELKEGMDDYDEKQHSGLLEE